MVIIIFDKSLEYFLLEILSELDAMMNWFYPLSEVSLDVSVVLGGLTVGEFLWALRTSNPQGSNSYGKGIKD